MKRLARAAIWFLVVAAIGRAIGAILSRRFVAGTSPSDDEFRLAGIMGGSDVSSTATSLRSVAVKALLGGVALDLSEATLHPEGATLDIEVTMGGVAVSLNGDWRVVVESELSAGDVVTELPDPETLPADAPQLGVRVRGHAGGVAISGS